MSLKRKFFNMFLSIPAAAAFQMRSQSNFLLFSLSETGLQSNIAKFDKARDFKKKTPSEMGLDEWLV